MFFSPRREGDTLTRAANHTLIPLGRVRPSTVTNTSQKHTIIPSVVDYSWINDRSCLPGRYLVKWNNNPAEGDDPSLREAAGGFSEMNTGSCSLCCGSHLTLKPVDYWSCDRISLLRLRITCET